LLPNLRSLEWHEGYSLWDAFLFLGPTLTNIHVLLRNDSLSLEGQCLLAALRAKVPLLKGLSIESDSPTHDKELFMSDIICSLSQLCRVSCPHFVLAPCAVIHLASLPGLQKLHLQLKGILEHIPQTSFPALQEVSTIVDDLSTGGNHFLALFSKSLALTDVRISTNKIPSSEQFHHFSSMIAKHCSPHNLTAIMVNLTWELEDLVPNYALEVHALEPLFACSNLESLKIRTPFTYRRIDNALLAKVASVWLQLQELDFVVDYCSFHHASADLVGLVHLSKCSCLHSVSLAFDVSLSHTMLSMDRPGNGICHETLTTLCVGYSPITNPRAVASVLLDVFPNISSIDMWEGYGNEDQEHVDMCSSWVKMKELYASFVGIRKQERLWAAKTDHKM